MTGQHPSYEDLAAQRRGSEEYREGHAEAHRAFLIGQAVRERRLGCSFMFAGGLARSVLFT